MYCSHWNDNCLSLCGQNNEATPPPPPPIWKPHWFLKHLTTVSRGINLRRLSIQLKAEGLFEIKLNAAWGQSLLTSLSVGLYFLVRQLNELIGFYYYSVWHLPRYIFMERSTWSEISTVDLRSFYRSANPLILCKGCGVNNKGRTNGNKCHQSQSLCFICSCNSITLPPRRPGICRRMSRSNSPRLVMVLSFVREMKYNIIK